MDDTDRGSARTAAAIGRGAWGRKAGGPLLQASGVVRPRGVGGPLHEEAQRLLRGRPGRGGVDDQ